MKLLKLTAKALLGVYCAALLGLALFQRDLQYHPGAAIVAPAQAGLATIETLKLASGDGETLVAWYAPPARDDLPLILYYHGNSGVLADRAARFRRLVASGYGLLAVSYRGYGGSTGTPTQDGILLDAEAAYNEALRRGFTGRRLLIMGESLGTGVAAIIASRLRRGGAGARRPVFFGAGCRRRPLSDFSGRAFDARHLPLGPRHRRCPHARADDARRSRHDHPDRLGPEIIRAGA